MIYSGVSGWQRDAARLEVRDGSSDSCSTAGWILWPQISAFADLFSTAVPSIQLKKLGAGAAALPEDFSLTVGL